MFKKGYNKAQQALVTAKEEVQRMNKELATVKQQVEKVAADREGINDVL